MSVRGDAPAARGSREQRLREFRYALRYLVSAYPVPYMAWARRHYAGTGIRVLGRDTEVVIEGFGRSGSTFAVDAFESAQARPIAIAHHTHAAAQVIEAARRDLPTLVLVREPMDAVLAHMVRRGIGPRPPLVAWIRYHRAILPYRERVVLGRMSALSTDLDRMIRAVNERFGTAFAEFQPTKQNVSQVFEGIERRNRERYGGAAVSLARPSAEREAQKLLVAHQLEAPELEPLRRRAREIYERLAPLPNGA